MNKTDSDKARELHNGGEPWIREVNAMILAAEAIPNAYHDGVADGLRGALSAYIWHKER